MGVLEWGQWEEREKEGRQNNEMREQKLTKRKKMEGRVQHLAPRRCSKRRWQKGKREGERNMRFRLSDKKEQTVHFLYLLDIQIIILYGCQILLCASVSVTV